MTNLDHSYIGRLATQAKAGDSDAFAELFAATYQRQYMFACSYLKDEILAQNAIQETYIAALKGINTLHDPKLFIAWLNQINLRVCLAMSKNNKNDSEAAAAPEPDTETGSVTIDGRNFTLNEIMVLPYSESQAIFLKYYVDMSIDDIAFIMESGKSSVKRYLASGKKRLAESTA